MKNKDIKTGIIRDLERINWILRCLHHTCSQTHDDVCGWSPLRRPLHVFPWFICFYFCPLSPSRVLYFVLPSPWFSVTWQFVFHFSYFVRCHVALGSVLAPSLPAISGSSDNEAAVHGTLSAAVHDSYPDANSRMPTWWLVVSPSFIFPGLVHSLLLSLCSLSLSRCLSAADLWDQPSKTDSYFFTDHECVSGYATREGEGEGRERAWICKWHICPSLFAPLLPPTGVSLVVKPLPRQNI